MNLGQSGLYRYRHAIYIIVPVLAAFTCSLAFTKKNGAYLSQGPQCSLPLRPFWYRLAIAWIPRYIILVIILGLYLAIYFHAMRQLKAIKRLAGPQSEQAQQLEQEIESRVTAQSPSDANDEHDRTLRGPSRVTKHSNVNSPRFESPDRKVSEGTTVIGALSTRNDSVTDPNANNIITLSKNPSILRIHKSFIQRIQARLLLPLRVTAIATATLPPLQRLDSDLIGDSYMARQMRHKREAIRRELRMLFIYPICYFAIWLFPFLNNLTQYSNYRAQHPVFALVLLTIISQSSMGALDSLIFGLRERPWRHIPGSDRTILGSFLFWHGMRQSRSRNVSNTGSHSTHSTVPLASVMSFGHALQTSGPVHSQIDGIHLAIRAPEAIRARADHPEDFPNVETLECWTFAKGAANKAKGAQP